MTHFSHLWVDRPPHSQYIRTCKHKHMWTVLCKGKKKLLSVLMPRCAPERFTFRKAVSLFSDRFDVAAAAAACRLAKLQTCCRKCIKLLQPWQGCHLALSSINQPCSFGNPGVSARHNGPFVDYTAVQSFFFFPFSLFYQLLEKVVWARGIEDFLTYNYQQISGLVKSDQVN